MQKYKHVSVSEKQLEDLVRQAPELIEEGLRFVDHQRRTTRGPLDVLLVDSARTLVVAELKIVEDDHMLIQALDYLDFVTTNVEGIARAYKQYEVDPTKGPRLFLIAPSFSMTLLNRCKWIDVDLTLFTFRCIQIDGTADVTPVYQRTGFPGFPPVVEEYSTIAMLDYITDPGVRALADDLIAYGCSLDAERVVAEARKGYVSIKLAGRVIGYVNPRRKWFVLSAQDDDGNYQDLEVATSADNDEAKKLLKANFDYYAGPT